MHGKGNESSPSKWHAWLLGTDDSVYFEIHDTRGRAAAESLLGDFKGESYGIGPAIFWSPKTEKGKLSVILKWMHDLDYENRMDGDYGQLIVAYQF